MLLLGAFLLSIIILYLQSGDETTLWEQIQGSWAGFLLFLVIGSGWIVAGNYTDQAWDGLKSAFPDQFQQPQLPKHYAFGSVVLSTPDTQPIGPIFAAAADDGLLIAKPKKKPKPRDFICVPWARILRVRVPPPKGLSACKSAKDCGQLSERLVAQLTISRGDYPPIEIETPWHDMFAAKLPPHIELVKDWEWPYALHTVI